MFESMQLDVYLTNINKHLPSNLQVFEKKQVCLDKGLIIQFEHRYLNAVTASS